MTRISVVIPSFGDAETIGDTLASLRDQDRAADEIIVVDDGSPAPLAGLVGEAAPTAQVIRHEENRGVQAARNTGFAAASGDYLLFLDADDTLCPEFLDVTAGLLDAQGETAAAFCDFYRVIKGEGAEVRARHTARRPPTVRALPRGAGFEHYLDGTGGFLPSFTLFRRTALEALCSENDLFFSQLPLKANEDFHLFCRFLARWDAVFIADPMGLYYMRDGSASKNQTRMWSDRVRALDSLLSLGDDAGFSPEQRAKLATIRDGAARRYARLLHDAGQTQKAQEVLHANLAQHRNAKTLALMTILAGRERWRRWTGKPAPSSTRSDGA